mmetsp:Transcript_1523/g.5426  ORF Transcript_1523/g.5426 Transcript_1523/m.5426 type:complete len:431 (+) Transcript_1523:647-1939(+)
MAGMRGSLPVPLTGADGTTRQPVGTAWLQAPQYACRLRFQRLTCLEDAAAVAPPEPVAGGVEGAAPAGLAAAHDDAGESAEVLPVDQVWHSGSAVLSAAEPSPEERLLLATAWSRAGYRKKLLAHGATLLPAKPAGAAQLLALTFSRHVRLLAPPADAAPAAGGAIAAQVADGERAVAFALPWLLRRADLDAINELRAALSGSVGERPAAGGGPAARRRPLPHGARERGAEFVDRVQIRAPQQPRQRKSDRSLAVRHLRRDGSAGGRSRVGRRREQTDVAREGEGEQLRGAGGLGGQQRRAVGEQLLSVARARPCRREQQPLLWRRLRSAQHRAARVPHLVDGQDLGALARVVVRCSKPGGSRPLHTAGHRLGRRYRGRVLEAGEALEAQAAGVLRRLQPRSSDGLPRGSVGAGERHRQRAAHARHPQGE